MFIMGKERDYIIHNVDVIKGFFGEYRWLSNFHECEVYFDGLKFPSTENAYVYAKLDAENTKDGSLFIQETIERLKTCTGALGAQAKKIGRSIKVRDDWDVIKYDIMATIVFDKFYRHQDLRKMLLSTGYKHIEETNHWKDTFWGVCDGKGQNKLGQIHMSIRDFWSKEYPDLLNKKKATKLF